MGDSWYWVRKTQGAALDEAYLEDAGLEFLRDTPDNVWLFATAGEIPEERNTQAEEFSQQFGEVLVLAEQDNVELFLYEHWRDGQCLRRLLHTQDAGWEVVEGTPEAWESVVLFTPEQKQKELRWCSDEEKNTVEEAFERKELREKTKCPRISATLTRSATEKHFELPAAVRPEE